MGLLTRSRKRDRALSFPNYELLQPQDAIELAESKLKKLEHIYHAAHNKAWDGRKVLDELMREHGGIHVDAGKREALASVFSVILWGELAAWVVSAELAEGIEDVEAKMAATSQAFDEARHFYVMRDYLREIGCDVPPLHAFSRTVLREILAADELAFKLVGMQLLVENVALSLFKMVGEAKVEPVLTGLMPYFARDEARHVGLGINYLPSMLRKMGTLDVVRLNVFQARIYTLLFWETMLLIEDFDRLGLDANASTRWGLRMQVDIASQIGKFSRDQDDRRAGRGVYVEPELLRRTHSFAIDGFMPHPGIEVPAWQQRVIRLAKHAARAGARIIDAVDVH